MKNIILIFYLIIFSNILIAQSIINIHKTDITKLIKTTNEQYDNKSIKTLYLQKATGKLKVFGNASTSSFTSYFIIPLSYKNQSPIWIDIDCPQLIDYRFIQLSTSNVVVAARLNNNFNDTIRLNWTSWVLAKKPDYSGIPTYVKIPTISELPDSVKPWLMPTACVQSTNTFIKHIADSLRDTTTNIISLASKIANYCYNDIPSIMPHNPWGFDAYYSLMWGNSCTGHAHAAAALFRANGIPCRVLMNIPTWANYYIDQHWLVEYYIPDYGWVRFESTGGINPYYDAQDEIITFACNPEDEFPLIYPDGIEGYWFSSDPVFTHSYPRWHEAHIAYQYITVNHLSSIVDQVISLSDSVYMYYTKYNGIDLNSQQKFYFNNAINYQSSALSNIKLSLVDSTIYYLNKALSEYHKIDIKPIKTIFFDNFETGITGWTHGGTNDNWEIGTPANVGPDSAYSGNNCWGTDIDNNYGNNVNCWLLSPQIDLKNLSCTYLSFWIWNDVQDSYQGENPIDKFWVEISINNGINFTSLTTYLGGVNDDPLIPSIGGWNHLVLDLTPYTGNYIYLRFNFYSSFSVTYAGSYIDDIYVYGRESSSSGIKENLNSDKIKIYPNPTNGVLNIENAEKSNVFIYNLLGEVILNNSCNTNNETIDLSGLSEGTYIVKVVSEKNIVTKKISICR